MKHRQLEPQLQLKPHQQLESHLEPHQQLELHLDLESHQTFHIVIHGAPGRSMTFDLWSHEAAEALG